MERLGAAGAAGLECAACGASACGRSDYGDPAEYLAGQFSDRFDAVRRLSARECFAQCFDSVWFSDHAGGVAGNVYAVGPEYLSESRYEEGSGEYGDGCEPV